jgi:hypothetical protein
VWVGVSGRQGAITLDHARRCHPRMVPCWSMNRT